MSEQVVVAHIRDLIEKGLVRPGDKLPQNVTLLSRSE